MFTDKIHAVAAARAKITALEQSIADELRSELAALPSRYGFQSAAEFVQAVKAAGDGRRGRRGRKAASAGPAGAGGGKKRRRRAKITDATRAEVKKMVAAGKTGAEIAKAVGISLPSVQNIKKALGLVQKRKK